eukprot:3175331-Pyramimonas_sp.AAC.1
MEAYWFASVCQFDFSRIGCRCPSIRFMPIADPTCRFDSGLSWGRSETEKVFSEGGGSCLKPSRLLRSFSCLRGSKSSNTSQKTQGLRAF